MFVHDEGNLLPGDGARQIPAVYDLNLHSELSSSVYSDEFCVNGEINISPFDAFKFFQISTKSWLFVYVLIFQIFPRIDFEYKRY